MTRVVVDAGLMSKLHNLANPLVLCDASGQVLATVIPAVDGFEPCEPEISEEELRRREQSDEWLTTQEVLAQLKNLEQS